MNIHNTIGGIYMKKTLFYIFVIAIIILIILRAEDVILYARDAMRMCYEIIIPTLFPFFICSSLLIYSGFGSVMAKLTSKIMRPLFNVPPSGAAAFVLGKLFGGAAVWHCFWIAETIASLTAIFLIYKRSPFTQTCR